MAILLSEVGFIEKVTLNKCKTKTVGEVTLYRTLGQAVAKKSVQASRFPRNWIFVSIQYIQ